MVVQIVVTQNLKLYEDQIKRLNQLGNVSFNNVDPESADDWLTRCKGADIICTGIFGLKSDKLYELNDVFISVPSVGVEFLDRKKLKDNNIVVSNSPGCNKEAVVEWIVGMMLMFYRRLCQLSNTTNQNKIEILQSATGLHNKKITILGSGHIGSYLGKVCESFGMEVTFFKRGDDLIESAKNADIIANCLSVNHTTKGFLDRKFFNSLKKGSLFVSASNHQTYDIEALKDALDKDILTAAIDDAANAEVGDVNELDYQKLQIHPKILVTPHISWNTDSERRKANDIMIDNIEAWINKKPINLI